MKKCSYCGKEYPDEATVCVIDTEPLFDPSKPPVEEAPLVKKEPPPKPKPAQTDHNLVWPDYQWSAHDAWKCIGILCMLMFVYAAVIHVQYLIIPHFYQSGFGFVCRRILFFAVWMITACYFARTETFATVLKAFGLDHKPTHYAWFGVTMALIIRFVSHYMYVHHWGKGVYNYEISSMRHAIGFQKLLFQFSPLVLAPIFEESVNRGFLYKAFRRSYPIAISMLLMVAWTCYTHWSYYYESWIAALNLSVWTVLQCYLREKSPSLWDCVLTHFVSNAVILFWDQSLW